MKTAHQNVPTPQQDQDAANKKYVDENGGGGGVELDYQPPFGVGPSSLSAFQALAIKPDGSKIYAGSSQSELWRIVTSSNTWDVTTPKAITLAGSVIWPTMFVMSPNGAKLYAVTGDNSAEIKIIDTATNTVTGTVTGLTGNTIAVLKMHPNGTEMWVQQNGSVVDRVSVSTDAVIGSFAGGPNTNIYDTGFSADGAKYYTTTADSSTLSIYDAATYTFITTFIPASGTLVGMCSLPDSSEMWFTHFTPGEFISRVYRISVSTNLQVGSPIDGTYDTAGTYYIVPKSDGSKVYMLLAGGGASIDRNGDINVFDVASHTLTNSISIGLDGSGDYGHMIINPSSTRLYVSSANLSATHWVKVIDLGTETVTATITNSSVTPPSVVTIGTFDALRITGAHLSDDGGGRGAIDLPVVFDNGATPYQNIKANRTGADAGAIDASKTGVANFGAASTASADYSTIGGGQNNVASGIGATVPGGNFNIASGNNSIAMGDGSNAPGEASLAANEAFAGGLASAAFNYATVEISGEASVALNDADIGPSCYGCTAFHSGSIGTNASYCHAEGSNSFIDNNAINCHAEGVNGYIAQDVDGSHIEGSSSNCEGDFGHIEGESGHISPGAYCGHVEGQGCSVTVRVGHAEGVASQASGYYAHAQGGATVAQGEGSHSEGDGCYAEGDWSHAQGSSSRAKRETQFAHGGGYSGGFGSGVGAAVSQTSWLQYRSFGSITGPSTTSDLRFGVNNASISTFVCENGRAYDFVFTAIVSGASGVPTYKTRTIKIKFNARCLAGVATIAGSGSTESYGDAATWTITPSAVGNTIVLTFDTGTDTETCYVAGNLQFVEVRFA